METNNIQTLLTKISEELKALNTAKNLYSQQLAPSFRIFDYIRTDELGISKILADLLNPQGNHAQKSLFLDKFMQICLVDLIRNKQHWQHFASEVVNVEIEKSTEHGRRMDIYLSNDIDVLCIENKPYAHDQKDQLIDYESYISSQTKGDYHLVYLAEYGEPSEHSVDKETYEKWQDEQKITWLKFSELIPWLTVCKAECENTSVVEFINQFIKFIQMEFMGIHDMSEEQAIVELMKKNSTTISSAIKISTNIKQLKIDLIEKLESDIQQILQDKQNYHYGGSNLDYHSRWDSSDIFFLLKDSPLQIHFQFDRTEFNCPTLCLRIGEDNSPLEGLEAESITAQMKQSYKNINIRSNKHWCAWYDFTPNDWVSSSEPWEMIHTGEMAKKIINEVDELYLILKKEKII